MKPDTLRHRSASLVLTPAPSVPGMSGEMFVGHGYVLHLYLSRDRMHWGIHPDGVARTSAFSVRGHCCAESALRAAESALRKILSRS